MNSYFLQNSINSNFKLVMHLNHIVYYIKSSTSIETIYLCEIRILSQNIDVVIFNNCMKSNSN